MRQKPRLLPLTLAALLALAACKQEVAQDTTPQEVGAETTGHYCQMNLAEHAGPKAQVHLEGVPGGPLFFSQVRDAIAYSRAPEQIAPILAIYVNDMGRAGATWEDPGEGNWIAADSAFYVVGSNVEGSMGAPETVPFASAQAAAAFVERSGGVVLQLPQIADAMVLAPVADPTAAGPATEDDDDDYLRRLRALSAPAGG